MPGDVPKGVFLVVIFLTKKQAGKPFMADTKKYVSGADILCMNEQTFLKLGTFVFFSVEW